MSLLLLIKTVPGSDDWTRIGSSPGGRQAAASAGTMRGEAGLPRQVTPVGHGACVTRSCEWCEWRDSNIVLPEDSNPKISSWNVFNKLTIVIRGTGILQGYPTEIQKFTI